MKKILLIPFLFIAIGLSAAPIGQQRAKELAAQFFSQKSTRAEAIAVEMEWAGNTLERIETRSEVDVEEALLYIFNRDNNAGWVIIAGDDNSSRTIVAFSDEGSFNVQNISPSTRWMLTRWCEDIEKARKSPIVAATRGEADLSTGNVILEIPTAKWGQGAPFNWLAPTFNGDRSVTGCVSTAISIVMRYFQWPEQGTGTIPGYTISHEYGEYIVPDRDLDYKYQWNKMLMEYHNGRYSTEQGNAVAQLMFDTGTAIHMNYTPGGSGAVTSRCCEILPQFFKYTRGSIWIGQNNFPTNQDWYEAMVDNIANYGPTIGSGGAHAYVLDGYTDKYYFHVNHGWGGGADGYYYLPENGFTREMSACFYLEPDPEGTSKVRSHMYVERNGDGYGIESSATEFVTGTPIHIRTAKLRNASRGTFRGDIHLVVTDKDGNIKETLHRMSNVSLDWNQFLTNVTFDVTITNEIESGDRIRYYFKRYDDLDWRWARRNGRDIIDELVLRASADEIAQNLQFTYDVDNKVISFKCRLATKYAFKDADGKVVFEGSMAGGEYFNEGIHFNVSNCEPGDYTISFTSGDEPYVLAVTL